MISDALRVGVWAAAVTLIYSSIVELKLLRREQRAIIDRLKCLETTGLEDDVRELEEKVAELKRHANE